MYIAILPDLPPGFRADAKTPLQIAQVTEMPTNAAGATTNVLVNVGLPQTVEDLQAQLDDTQAQLNAAKAVIQN